jgi:hypothetical protein
MSEQSKQSAPGAHLVPHEPQLSAVEREEHVPPQQYGKQQSLSWLHCAPTSLHVHSPQSCGHVPQLSFAWQTPFPQMGTQ